MLIDFDVSSPTQRRLMRLFAPWETGILTAETLTLHSARVSLEMSLEVRHTSLKKKALIFDAKKFTNRHFFARVRDTSLITGDGDVMASALVKRFRIPKLEAPIGVSCKLSKIHSTALGKFAWFGVRCYGDVIRLFGYNSPTVGVCLTRKTKGLLNALLPVNTSLTLKNPRFLQEMPRSNYTMGLDGSHTFECPDGFILIVRGSVGNLPTDPIIKPKAKMDRDTLTFKTKTLGESWRFEDYVFSKDGESFFYSPEK